MENRWKKTDERNVLEVKEKAGVTYLSYPLLEHTKCVRHAFSTRLGGVSEGIYASMNLSFSRGDDPKQCGRIFTGWQKCLRFRQSSMSFLRRHIQRMFGK